MRGRGTAFGAISIVNAIAGGRGVTAGVRLKTETTVELVESRPGGWTTTINGKPVRSRLAREVVRTVLHSKGKKYAGFCGTIETTSNIPIGAGLKSSSSSSVAMTLATLAALGEEDYHPATVLKLSVEASLSAGVTITGALDDATSCLNGGINFADNLKRRIIRSEALARPLSVVIKVPRMRSRRDSVTLQYMRRFGKLTESAFKMAEKGDTWGAMVLNGIVYSAVLRYDASPAMRALTLGALGSGLSGTGPAVAAVFKRDAEGAIELLRKDWGRDGSKVIVTESNDERGEMVCLD